MIAWHTCFLHLLVVYSIILFPRSMAACQASTQKLSCFLSWSRTRHWKIRKKQRGKERQWAECKESKQTPHSINSTLCVCRYSSHTVIGTHGLGQLEHRYLWLMLWVHISIYLFYFILIIGMILNLDQYPQDTTVKGKAIAVTGRECP
jgi:hypothetical protein